MFFLKLKWWWQLIIISLLSLAIYAPIAGNSFLNDDFIVIKRVCIDGQLIAHGFFRPLSDISIFFTYQLSGLHPLPFYLTGILLHGLSTLLLIRLCIDWQWTSDEVRQKRFALLTGMLFFTYPFHNESVAWILGRGALIANTLGIAALLILVRPGGQVLKIILVCICYFVGLAAYETVVVLPGMVFIYLLFNKAGNRQIAAWILALGVTLLLHLLLRIGVSGSLAGEYGSRFFSAALSLFIVNAGKALGRTFLPPMDSPELLILLFVIFLGLAVGVLFYLHKRLCDDKQALFFLYTQIGFFLTALLIPSLTSVSTRTSESDRLLHFPSYFISIIMAFGLLHLIRTKWVWIIAVVVVCSNIYLLEQNNMNWRKASASVEAILRLLQNNKDGQKTYIANLPEEIDGAFIFRVGFQEALLVNKIDTERVEVLSRLPRDSALLLPRKISYRREGNLVIIPPLLKIEKKSDNRFVAMRSDCGNCNRLLSGNYRLIYWNQAQWIIVPL